PLASLIVGDDITAAERTPQRTIASGCARIAEIAPERIHLGGFRQGDERRGGRTRILADNGRWTTQAPGSRQYGDAYHQYEEREREASAADGRLRANVPDFPHLAY